MSPTLFNVFIDFLARLLLSECAAKGIKGFTVAYRIGGVLMDPGPYDQELQILLLMYADDIVLLAEDGSSLHAMLQVLAEVTQQWGMEINYKKTKIMVFDPQADAQTGPPQQPTRAHPACDLHPLLARVFHFKYLGSTMDCTAAPERELNSRLCQAGGAFRQLGPRVFSSRAVRLSVKVQIYKTIVVPILIYAAAESWALTAAQLQRLSVFHTTCARRMLGISRLEGVSNVVVLARCGMRSMSDILQEHRMRWLGHMGRMDAARWPRQALFARVVPGQRRPVGRPEQMWTDVAHGDLVELGQSAQWLTTCQDRTIWKGIITKD